MCDEGENYPTVGSGWRKSVSKTCKHGHRWTKANTYTTPTGYRMCHECRCAAVERWRHAHPELARKQDREQKRRARRKRA